MSSPKNNPSQFDQDLIEACQQNDLESVKQLLTNPEVDLRAQNYQAFRLAAQNKNFRLLTLFLKQSFSTPESPPSVEGKKMFEIAKEEVPEINSFAKLVEETMEKVSRNPQLYLSSESEREKLREKLFNRSSSSKLEMESRALESIFTGGISS